MSELSEEEIIKYFKEVIIWYREYTPDRVYALNNKDIEMLQGLLDLYNKEKQKNIKQKEHIDNINKRNSNQRVQLNKIYQELEKEKEKNKELEKRLEEIELQILEDENY